MYKVQLTNFEGPLDLLLYFIRRDEIDIYDIPIAKITREYMTTLEIIEQLNIAVAGDFIEMAAILMRIKVRMLLPAMKLEEGEIEDPRGELVQRLLEYQQFRDAAEKLKNLSLDHQSCFPRGSAMTLPAGDENPAVYLRETTLYDIARYFQELMDRMPVIHSYELQREQISLEKQKVMILSHFDGDGRLRFSTIVKKLNSKFEIIITFLAVLELIRISSITVVQDDLFSDIELQLLKHRA